MYDRELGAGGGVRSQSVPCASDVFRGVMRPLVAVGGLFHGPERDRKCVQVVVHVTVGLHQLDAHALAQEPQPGQHAELPPAESPQSERAVLRAADRDRGAAGGHRHRDGLLRLFQQQILDAIRVRERTQILSIIKQGLYFIKTIIYIYYGYID